MLISSLLACSSCCKSFVFSLFHQRGLCGMCCAWCATNSTAAAKIQVLPHTTHGTTHTHTPDTHRHTYKHTQARTHAGSSHNTVKCHQTRPLHNLQNCTFCHLNNLPSTSLPLTTPHSIHTHTHPSPHPPTLTHTHTLTLMGMPVQWKPCPNSTRLPHRRWYAAANSSCNKNKAGGAATGHKGGVQLHAVRTAGTHRSSGDTQTHDTAAHPTPVDVQLLQLLLLPAPLLLLPPPAAARHIHTFESEKACPRCSRPFM